MKNRLLTLSLREIKKSFRRFISLLIISFLGVSVFVGMRTTSKTMFASLDKYYDINNVYDLKIVSTLGLTNEDILEIEKLESIKDAYGIHTKDVYLYGEEENYILKIVGINDNINKPVMIQGRLPINNEEIIVEDNLLDVLKINIGDKINISFEKELNSSEFTIVGTCYNPTYILASGPSVMRGTTNIGTGQVNFYSYTLDDLFEMDYYTEIYASVVDAKEDLTNSLTYNKKIDKAIEELKDIKSSREEARYNQVYQIASDEISKNEQAYLDAIKKLDDAKYQLKIGFNELNNTKKKLEDGKNKLQESKIKLDDAKEKIIEGEEKLQEGKKDLAKAKEEINQSLSNYNIDIDDVLVIYDLLIGENVEKERMEKLVDENSPSASSFHQVIDYIYDNNYIEKVNNYFESGSEKAKQALISIIPTSIKNYDEIISFINNIDLQTVRKQIIINLVSPKSIEQIKKIVPKGIKNYDKVISFLDKLAKSFTDAETFIKAVDMINDGENEIAKSEVLLENAKCEYENGYQTYLTYQEELKKAEEKLANGYNTYYYNLDVYNQNLKEFDTNRIDYEKKLNDAKADLASLKVPVWYINSRMDNSDYANYINVGENVNSLSITFPTVFFVVAIFMSTMSMSRMAMEDRGEIGALKSLGFDNRHIIMKYFIYASFATLIGGVLGSIFGFLYLTYFIWKMYHIIFSITEFCYYFDILPFIIGIFVSFISITGVAIITIISIVKENTAALLRPKAPKKGKIIWIEKLNIWKKLKFSNKVTIRNIFRYKKRVIMTIIGISGCTILLISGYGIRDSIINITNKQYSEVQIFDDFVYLDNRIQDVEHLMQNSKIKNKLGVKLLNGYVNGKSTNIDAFNPDDNKSKILNLVSNITNKEIELEKGKVVITSKIANILHLKIGDTFIFKDNDNNEYEFIISDICKNYIGHRIFMDPETYDMVIGGYSVNMLYLSFNNPNDEEEVIKELLEDDDVLLVSNVNATKVIVDNMTKSLDSVVFILIIFSGLLSFVVLYNLSYINISERKREIASLKVLGFYYHEVDNYIIKENLIITLFGIIIGLLFGKPFVDFIINSIEIDLIAFIREISIASYFYTAILMIFFVAIVSVIIHFVLKKINMIDALKSVE